MTKKLLTLLLILTIGFGAVPTIAAGFTDTDGTRYEKAANLLSTLGFISGYSDGTFDVGEPMTRAEYATILAKIANLDEMTSDSVYFYDVTDGYWAKDAINIMYQQGYMTATDNMFYPESPVTLEDVARGAVYLLGYSYNPKDSITVAAELGVFKGITLGSEVTRGDILLILYNVLETEKAVSRSYMNEQEEYVLGEVVKGGTLLEENFDVYKATGQFTALGDIDLVRVHQENEAFVRIDDVRYRLADGMEIPKEYLAYSIEFYYRDEEGAEEPELIYYTPKGENEVVSATAKDIISSECTTTRFVYQQENRTRTRTIPFSAKFIVNGHLIADQDKQDTLFDITSGQVRVVLPANGNNALVWIDTYEYALVQALGNTEIYLKDGRTIDMDDDKQGQEVAVYSSTGEETEMTDILANSAIAIAEVTAADGILYRNVHVLKSVSGIVNEISDDSITVGETTYDKDEGLTGVKVGFQYNLFVGMNGEICLADINLANTILYGYLIDAALSNTGVNNKFEMKILNSAGSKEIYEVESSIYVNDILVKKDEIASGSAANVLYNPTTKNVVRQVVAYMVNEENSLTKIYTAQEGEDSVLSLDSESQTLLCKTGAIFNFGGKLTVKDSGVIIAVPSDKENADEDDFDVLPTTYFTNDGQYSVEGYNVNELLEADVIVVTVNSADSAFYDPGNTYTCVFDEKTQIVTEDGELSYSITYWQQGTKYTKALEVRFGKKTYESTLAAVEKIKRGDCFQIELTNDGSKIKNISIEFSAENRSETAVGYNSSRTVFYGQIEAIGTNSLVIRQFTNNPDTNYVNENRYLYKNAGRVGTYLYTGEDRPIELIPNCLADARVGDWVVYQARYGAARAMVIYRDDTRLPTGEKVN